MSPPLENFGAACGQNLQGKCLKQDQVLNRWKSLLDKYDHAGLVAMHWDFLCCCVYSVCFKILSFVFWIILCIRYFFFSSGWCLESHNSNALESFKSTIIVVKNLKMVVTHGVRFQLSAKAPSGNAFNYFSCKFD